MMRIKSLLSELILLIRILLGREKSYIIVSPAWYAFGEMFESLFLAVNLACHYNKELILTYSNVHLKEKTDLPAICNHELKTFLVDGVGIIGNPVSTISKLLSLYISFSRKYHKTLWGKVARKLSGEKLLRPKIGFWGHKDEKGLQQLLGLNRPVSWKSVLKSPVEINLTLEQDKRGRKALLRLGIPEGKLFVCLYVRDAAFVKKYSTRMIFKHYTADIRTYRKAIKTISDKGFYVIRMGDPSAVSISDDGHFIDYVHTSHYSKLLDLYLYRHCTVMVCSGGGPRFASIFYSRDTIVTNWAHIHLCGYCIGKNDVFITKHVYSIHQDRFLCLREQLELIDTVTDNWGFFDPNEFILVDNDEDEINQVIVEWYDRHVEGADNRDDNLQKAFHDLRQKHTRIKFDNDKRTTGRESGYKKYFHFRPRIGNQFLEDCWEYGDYLENMTQEFNEGRQGKLKHTIG